MLVAPVAGGQSTAILVDEREGGCAAGSVGLLQLAVEAGDIGGAQRVAQRILELGIKGQYLGQGAITIHPLHHSLGMQAELALHALTFIAERGLQCNTAGCPHAQQHAAEHDEQGQKETGA